MDDIPINKREKVYLYGKYRWAREVCKNNEHVYRNIPAFEDFKMNIKWETRLNPTVMKYLNERWAKANEIMHLKMRMKR